MESPSKIFAAVLAMTAFAIAIVSGLAKGGGGPEILSQAIFSMIVCYPVGLVLGLVAGHAVDEHISGYVKGHPVPKIPSFDSSDDSEIIDVDVL